MTETTVTRGLAAALRAGSESIANGFVKDEIRRGNQAPLEKATQGRPVDFCLAIVGMCAARIDAPTETGSGRMPSAEISKRTTLVGGDMALSVDWLRRLERRVVDRALAEPSSIDIAGTRHALALIGDVFTELSNTQLQAHTGTKDELDAWYERVTSDLMTCLAANAPVERSLINSQSRILAIDPHQPFRAVTMHHDGSLSTPQWQKVLRRLGVVLRRYDPDLEHLIRETNGLLLAIVPADRESDVAQVLESFLRQEEFASNLFVSTGEPTESLATSGRSCQQAFSALEIGTYREQRGKVIECTEVILEVLLTHNHWVSKRIAKSRLQHIVDKPNLLDTLRAYISCDMAMQRTAEELFVHPNTVAYRLRQIGQLTGRDMRSVSDLSDLRLALAATDILDMQRSHESGASTFLARFLGD